MTKTFGTVTIGQAPRTDVTGEMLAIIGEGWDIVEAGALDGMTREEIDRLAPRPGEDVLVTRLADGSTVMVAERHITPLVQERVNALFDRGLPLVVLLCTGAFPQFETRGLLLRPQEILYHAAASLGRGRRVGVLTPTPDHIPQVARLWADVLGAAPIVIAASPYQETLGALEGAAQWLKEDGVELAVLDCIGYTREMQLLVREVSGAPALLARGLAARVVKELLG